MSFWQLSSSLYRRRCLPNLKSGKEYSSFRYDRRHTPNLSATYRACQKLDTKQIPRDIPDPIKSVGAQVTKAGATLAAEASGVKSAGADLASSAVAAGATLISKLGPKGAAAGTKEACGNFSGTWECISFPMMMAVIPFTMVFATLSAGFCILSVKVVAVPFVVPLFSVLSWMASAICMSIALAIFIVAWRLQDRLQEHLPTTFSTGFALKGAITNFVAATCQFLISCVGP